MPDSRRHRGPHPEDAALFAAGEQPRLRLATDELSWLLSRGYASESSLKLVGDRHALKQRQRVAIGRCACADERVRARRARMVSVSALRGVHVMLDGFNVLTTLEVALAGGIVLIGRDGAARDIAGVHGSYRKVEETVPALALVAAFAVDHGVERCTWLLDRPVSNSGRLRAVIEERARAEQWPFDAEVVPDPDQPLKASARIVASADGVVLDHCKQWVNLARECIARLVPSARIVDLSVPLSPSS